MRVVPMLFIAGLLTSCSAPEPSGSADHAESGESAAVPAAPGINVTAAPGVAFAYRYDFRLAAARITATQERHAQACEKLGIDRCRITGMQYRLIGEDDVSAMLAFRLEPGLARQFGKDGIAAVTQAEGMLTLSEITGVDEGANISAATGAEARLAAERARIEARLRGTLSDDERARLTAELAELRRSLEASREGRATSERALTGTPMVFNYAAGEGIPGFGRGSPLGDALRTAGDTMLGAIAMLIVILGALIPFGAVALLALLLWRRLRPALQRTTDEA